MASTRDYAPDDPAAPLFVLAHGAGAGHDHPWMTRVAGALRDAGIHVVTFNFPYMERAHASESGERRGDRGVPASEPVGGSAGAKPPGVMETRRGAPDRAPVLEASYREVWESVAQQHQGRRMFAGGKSMGGRIASQVAASGGFTPTASGLVFFGYPLHPPGQPQKRRDAHLPSITAPMLFLQGSRDGFGTPEEMTALVKNLPAATLEIVERGDHSLMAPKSQDPTGQSLDRAIKIAAEWIKGT